MSHPGSSRRQSRPRGRTDPDLDQRCRHSAATQRCRMRRHTPLRGGARHAKDVFSGHHVARDAIAGPGLAKLRLAHPAEYCFSSNEVHRRRASFGHREPRCGRLLPWSRWLCGSTFPISLPAPLGKSSCRAEHRRPSCLTDGRHRSPVTWTSLTRQVPPSSGCTTRQGPAPPPTCLASAALPIPSWQAIALLRCRTRTRPVVGWARNRLRRELGRCRPSCPDRPRSRLIRRRQRGRAGHGS